MTKYDQGYALDYIKRELQKEGRRVDIGVFSLRHPARVLYERKNPWYKFWARREENIAFEGKWDPNTIYYDSSDTGLVEIVKKAQLRPPHIEIRAHTIPRDYKIH